MPGVWPLDAAYLELAVRSGVPIATKGRALSAAAAALGLERLMGG